MNTNVSTCYEHPVSLFFLKGGGGVMLIRPLSVQSDLRCEFLWDKLVISIRIHKTISPKDFATGSSCFVNKQEAA